MFPTMHFRLTYRRLGQRGQACRRGVRADPTWRTSTGPAHLDPFGSWRRVSPSTTPRCGTRPSPRCPKLRCKVCSGKPGLKIYDRAHGQPAAGVLRMTDSSQ